MTKNYEELFQDRVDELLLLEQRADRRAEKFIEITNNYQEKNQKALDDLLGKVGGIDASLAKMNAASDQVRDYVDYSEKHALRTAKLFLGTVIGCALFVAGTLWWSHHIISGLPNNPYKYQAVPFRFLPKMKGTILSISNAQATLSA